MRIILTENEVMLLQSKFGKYHDIFNKFNEGYEDNKVKYIAEHGDYIIDCDEEFVKDFIDISHKTNVLIKPIISFYKSFMETTALDICNIYQEFIDKWKSKKCKNKDYR